MSKPIEFAFAKLDHQTEAVNSVINLMSGLQRKSDSIYGNRTRALRHNEHEHVANKRIVKGQRLLRNLRKVQEENNLFRTDELQGNNFTIEMETGTGKTYVYLKTILELNANYQFTKFIIVVPSVAIRSGVMKSIKMLSKHFKTYGIDLAAHSFMYDANNMGQISTALVESQDLSICVMNTQAFNKASINKIRNQDEYEKVLWDDMRGIRPIVIIDEPQKMEGTEKKKSESLNAIEALEPLFVLRYSATHKKLYNLIYKLDSYDAFDKELVKKIEVKTIHSDISKSSPYIRYLNFTDDLKARIEIFHQEQGGRILFKSFDVKGNDSLYDLSGKMAQYENMRITEEPHKLKPLKVATPESVLELPLGKSNIEKSDIELVRIQIAITIKEHLDKQFAILDKGEKIKVLSLFFIDEVSKVRDYTQADHRGIYLRIFDQEYQKLVTQEHYKKKFEKYQAYFKQYKEVNAIREGYFAIDKNKKEVEVEITGWDVTKEEYKVKAKSQEDIDRAIELILDKKDELISFDEPLAFVFSHSALREGWDNPNVFNICTLKEGASEIAKKQEIGRGLRLPVDIEGVRCKDMSINKLTVIANDNYEHFAKMLQDDFNSKMEFNREEVTPEIIKDTLLAAGVPKVKVTSELVNCLREELLSRGMINQKNIATKEMKNLKEITFENEILHEHELMIKEKLVHYMASKGSRKVPISNGDNEKSRINAEYKFVREPQFRAIIEPLVKNLKKRTLYHAPIDKEKFIMECINEINDYTRYMHLQMQYVQEVAAGGFEAHTKKFEMEKINQDLIDIDFMIETERKSDFEIANYMMYHTMLPRLALLRIIKGVENREVLNHQDILEMVTAKIAKQLKKAKAHALVEEKVGNYELIKGYELDRKSIFELDQLDEEQFEALKKEKKVYETDESKKRAMNRYYQLDSKGEYAFASALEKSLEVLLFTKLKRGGFIIDTPYGNYTPDWAIICKKEDDKPKLYFVVETKCDKDQDDLSFEEQTKIICGKLHFAAVSEHIKFDWVDNYETFKHKFMES